jgi:hypothetical protein
MRQNQQKKWEEEEENQVNVVPWKPSEKVFPEEKSATTSDAAGRPSKMTTKK